MKVIVPEIETQKTCIVDPFWSVKQTVESILSNVCNPPPSSPSLLDVDSQALFLAPLEHLKDNFSGVWLLEDEIIGDCDLINQVLSQRVQLLDSK